MSVHKIDATPERFIPPSSCLTTASTKKKALPMNSIIYIVGLIVIVMAILSFIGLA